MYFAFTATLFVGYLLLFYLNILFKHKKSPPGPVPIPILGNLIQIGLASPVPSLAFHIFAKRYGDVFRLRMGVKDLVVATSMESITNLYGRSETVGRDRTGTMDDRSFRKNVGIAFADGPTWEKTKQWMIRNLRDYGFGKSSSMEDSIKKEIKLLFKEFDRKRERSDNIVHVSNTFTLSSVKSLWKMVTGECREEDVPVIEDLLLKSRTALANNFFSTGIVNAYPSVRPLMPVTTGHAVFMEFYTAAHQAARSLLQKTRDTLGTKESSCEPTSLVEAFVLEAITQEKKGTKTGSIFEDENFIIMYLDLLQAGSDSSAAFLESFVLFMILYPDVQDKIFQEIKKFVGNNEITLAHKDKMIYTQAFIWEIHRYARIAPNLVPRRVIKDFEYKGMIIIANMYTANFDEKLWEDATEFKPERFIGKDGRLQKLNNVIPFGAGKRLCPGEVMSHATSFLYMISLLKRYKLTTIPGKEKPRQAMREGFSSMPYPFDAMFLDRLTTN